MRDSRAETCSSIAELLDLFDEAWQRGAPLRIDELLACPAARQSVNRRHLIEELISTDLEYRWRGKGVSTALECYRLEDYTRLYAELGQPERLPLELIGQEYRVRQCWGDRPGHLEYTTRFAAHGQQLAELLKRIDAELAAEFGRDRRGLAVAAPFAGIPTAEPVAATASIDLAQTLRGQQLLGSAQLAELDRDLAHRFPDPRALARELLQRNWLTPYQVNQLLQGRGANLVVGPYLLLERLGEGGAGQVFKARHPKMDSVVALKLIRKDLLTDADTLARFSREVQLLSQLNHPNIVHALDAGVGGGTHFLAMEFVEGSDLGRLVKQGGPMPVLQACEYIRQAACGLAHAHERGLVHRDIKPHNLIMSLRDGLIKVADLGLARLPRLNQEPTQVVNGQAGTGTLTPRNAVMGTPDYMAPEQALEFRNADIRADIYSLGCTFFFLLTGQPPFSGGTLAQTLLRHQQVPPPEIDKLRQDIPSGLPVVLAKMLAKRPEDRYQTPSEVATALTAVGHGPLTLNPSPARGEGSKLPARRLAGFVLSFLWRLRHCWRSLLSAGAVLLLLATALYFFFPSADRTRRSSIEVLREAPGSTQALTAAKHMMQLSWPMDQLQNKNIPQELRVANLPPEVVAVLHPGGAPGEAYRVVISLDGKTIASAGQDGLIHLWDAATAKKRITLKGHGGPVRALAFSPDSKLLASGSEDTTLRLWDVSTASDRIAQTKNTCPWDTVSLSLDGKQLVAGSRHGFVNTWDLPGLNRLCDFRSKNGIWSMALAPDGQTVALGSETTLEFWKLPAGKELAGSPFKTGRLLAYAPNGQTLAYISPEAPIFRLRALATGTDTGLPLKQHLVSNPRYLEFSLDGKLLFTTIDDATAIVWDVTSKQQVGYWPMPGGSCSESYGGASLAPDGRHLVTPHRNGNVYIRRLIPVAK